MIYVIDELHLNDFKEVRTVRPRDLFCRYGKRLPNTDFESSDEFVPMNMSKLDSIEYLEQYDLQMQYELELAESSKNHHSQNNDFEGDSGEQG